MKRKNRLIKKQLWKYATILLVAIAGISGYRLFISMSNLAMTYVFSTVAVLLVVMLAFDLASVTDVLPILRG